MEKRIHEHELRFQKAWLVITMIKEYNNMEPAGGTLHNVIEDGNYDKHNVQGAFNFAEEKGDYWGKAIAKILLSFEEKEIENIIERPWEIEEFIYK